MFTGIVATIGKIRNVTLVDDRMQITVEAPFDDLVLGESVAIDGACLTVVEIIAEAFRVDAVVTTRGRTKFDEVAEGDLVNLERALSVGERLGGHFVQGHVDGVGVVAGIEQATDALLINIEMPQDVAEISVLHGSIAVNGVSMTINALPSETVVQISVIPFTLEHTNLGGLVVGDRVHLESDMLGKFVRQLMTAQNKG
jgi:riboflavin synthase